MNEFRATFYLSAGFIIGATFTLGVVSVFNFLVTRYPLVSSLYIVEKYEVVEGFIPMRDFSNP